MVNILRTAFFVVVALIIQYYYLQGSAKAVSGSFQVFEHSTSDYRLSAEFPGSTEVHLTPDMGEDMLLNIYFTDSKLQFRGYIQLWSLDNLEQFLNDSKEKSTYHFRSFLGMEVELNGYHGFHEEWTADFGDRLISAKEYWLEINKPGEAVRITFYSDTAEFPEHLVKPVNHILKSLKVDYLSSRK